MPRRLLIVSPSFPPANTPDQHRVRVALHHLSDCGWECEVLAVRPNRVAAPEDPGLTETLPTQLQIHRAHTLPIRWGRRLRIGDLGVRALPGLLAAGCRLLSRRKFDLAFFSTTAFPVMALGPVWKGLFGLPYVLDFQDPWRSDYYAGREHLAPGGQFKYGLSQSLASVLEPGAVRHAGHIVSVSPRYPVELRKRYPEVPEDRFSVLPFSASPEDFAIARRPAHRQRIFNRGDGCKHLVYAGVIAPSMARSVEILLRGVALRREKVADRLRLHFVGTSYDVGAGPGLVTETASRLGMLDVVDERPARVPYLEGLSALIESDAVVVVGSDDAGYNPSKIYSCILSGRPTLAILHTQSLGGELLRRSMAGPVIPLSNAVTTEAMVQQVAAALDVVLGDAAPIPNPNACPEYSAQAMTKSLCQIFDKAAAERPCRVRSSASSMPIRMFQK